MIEKKRLFDWSESDIKRFNSKTYYDEYGVLMWGASCGRNNYGHFWIKGKTVLAHRAAYDLYGPDELSDELCVLHVIDNPQIVDYRFLFLGTPTDNHKDMCNKDRIAKGSQSGVSVLSETQVLEIYRRIWAGETKKALALEFGVGPSTIQHIKHGRNWSWLTGHKRAA